MLLTQRIRYLIYSLVDDNYLKNLCKIRILQKPFKKTAFVSKNPTMTNQYTFDLNRIKLTQGDLNEKIFKRLNKSVLFVDNQFLEWFNLTSGIGKLIKSGGIQNIKKFNSFQASYFINVFLQILLFNSFFFNLER